MMIIALALGLFLSCTDSKKEDSLKISIFADHIEAISRQDSIPFAEAAARVKELGYKGADVWVTQNPDNVRILDSLGFVFPSAIAYVDYCLGEQPEMEERTIRFMKEHNIGQVLLVPGLIREGSFPLLMDTVRMRIVKFWERAKAEGLDILMEDYDHFQSPCCGIQRLDSIFMLAPDMGHVLDTGNYYFCEDDVLEAYEKYQGRIRHVHMKDRIQNQRNGLAPAVGEGVIPIKEIVGKLRESGYEGWFTVEHFGAPDMYEYAKTSIQNFKNF